jgi:DNA-binding LytR/AlgR family response regulator
MNIITNNGQPILEIQAARGLKLIPVRNILFIQSSKKKSIIQLYSSERIQTNYLIKAYCNCLPKPLFFRCHNSYLVNCRIVDYFSSTEIILQGNRRIPLSRRRKKEFKNNLIVLLQNRCSRV